MQGKDGLERQHASQFASTKNKHHHPHNLKLYDRASALVTLVGGVAGGADASSLGGAASCSPVASSTPFASSTPSAPSSLIGGAPATLCTDAELLTRLDSSGAPSIDSTDSLSVMGADGGADARVAEMAGLSGGARGVHELIVLDGLTTLSGPCVATLASGVSADSGATASGVGSSAATACGDAADVAGTAAIGAGSGADARCGSGSVSGSGAAYGGGTRGDAFGTGADR